MEDSEEERRAFEEKAYEEYIYNKERKEQLKQELGNLSRRQRKYKRRKIK